MAHASPLLELLHLTGSSCGTLSSFPKGVKLPTHTHTRMHIPTHRPDWKGKNKLDNSHRSEETEEERQVNAMWDFGLDPETEKEPEWKNG